MISLMTLKIYSKLHTNALIKKSDKTLPFLRVHWRIYHSSYLFLFGPPWMKLLPKLLKTLSRSQHKNLLSQYNLRESGFVQSRSHDFRHVLIHPNLAKVGLILWKQYQMMLSGNLFNLLMTVRTIGELHPSFRLFNRLHIFKVFTYVKSSLLLNNSAPTSF